QQGVDVIVDDTYNFARPYFQDGPIALQAEATVAAGITYVVAAGNFGAPANQPGGHHWWGVFDPFNIFSSPTWHVFAGGDNLGSGDIGDGVWIAPGATFNASLQWSDAWGGSGNDYDLLLMDGDSNFSTTVLASGLQTQNGNDAPYESL